MITRIRNSRWVKSIAMVMIFQILFPLIIPPEAHAITGGPAQPEFTTFTPVGVSDMVDPFSGDFSYNIPLMDVGGYPINISYSSGISMEQQAGSVGLGWTLNAGGAVTRNMRGIPDDFDGTDKIVTTTNLKPNTTIGVNFSAYPEIVGYELDEASNPVPIGEGPGPLKLGFGLFHNNYTGVGFEANMSPSLAVGGKNGSSLDFGLGFSANSKEGIGVSPQIGLSKSSSELVKNEVISTNGSLGLSASYNSRAGLRSIGVEQSFNKTVNDFTTTARKSLKGYSGGGSIPLGYNTYIPQVNQSMTTASVSANIGTGLEAFWTTGKMKVGGYFNIQKLKRPEESKAAYGFFYADKGINSDDAMHDFNREKDGAFTDNTPALPMAQMTYDVYTVSGQGVGGMFRPHRDFGTVYDPKAKSNTGSGSFGGDIAAGGIFKGGVNTSFGFGYSRSGRWSNNKNETRDELSFNGRPDPNNPGTLDAALYEPFYMKNAGEFTTIDEDYFEKIQGFDPVRINITQTGRATEQYWRRTAANPTNETVVNPIQDNKRTTRAKRNQPMTLLPAGLAQYGALDKELISYEVNNVNGMVTTSPKQRVGENGRQAHHISEIIVDRPDGARYIYGNQTYNLLQREVSFNVFDNGSTPDIENGLVGYSGNDNSTNNNRGIDHFFSSTELPPYATAYQLTNIISADYVDLQGDGATPDDLGTYTKFNYRTKYGKDASNPPYQWRNPYNANTANFSEGYKAKASDNKGNYLYGEKEIKMLESIETKNYIAEFHYSDRKDAYEVAGENGGQGDRTLEKLDKIILYTRCDRESNQGNAIPLKTVHFVYDYSLCQNIPSNRVGALTGNEISNERGKLTLKKIYFTYEDSKKGQFSPYEFHYGDANHDFVTEPELNPDYSFRGNDRWGNYKPNVLPSGDVCMPTNGNYLTNAESPYVGQNRDCTDKYAAAWSLTTIELPSGGLIKVELESDDYAYVQNKRATKMFQVTGFSATEVPSTTNKKLYVQGSNYPYMHFDAPLADLMESFNTASDEQKEDEFRRRYIGEGEDEITELFYKFLIDVTGRQEGQNEYISGYATIEETGWANGTGWIKVELTTLKDRGNGDNIHPIAKTAMQFVRINLSDIVMGNDPGSTNVGQDLWLGLVGLYQDAKSMLVGVNLALRGRDVGKYVDTDKSFIRLQTPDYKKLGGGVRVSKIAINDQWGTMSGNDAGDFDYGQTYNYNVVSKDAASSIPVGSEISSGVAVYEPFIGNEENPLRQPNDYSEDRKMAPDNAYYQEMPYGETFFPSASVGYSYVTVSNLSRTGVSRTATGHIVHEFYTAKDFPVKIKSPVKDQEKYTTGLLGQALGISVVDNKTLSQSYAIELNDMHGKPQAQRVYAEGQETPISSVKYFYKQEGNTLDNTIKVIDKSGNVSDAQAGVDIDMTIDERESKNMMTMIDLDFNLDISPIPFPFPPIIPIPSVWGKASMEETRFRSIANTKVITRYGILEKTVAEDLGSSVSTENLAWDSETGEVLLTRTENDFEDPVYAFSYPAHWAYDGMGQAYKNIGAIIDLDSPDAETYLTPGDELITPVLGLGPTQWEKVWVSELEANDVTFVDREGEEVNPYSSLIVTRSGRRNQQSTPVGSITTLTDPIQGNTLSFQDVINAGAVEFKDDWGGFCMCSESITSYNPYVNGKKGSYRPVRSHAFLTDRNQPNDLGDTNIRKDGTFEEFTPFWTPESGQDWGIEDEQWTFASEVTLVSPYGLELENKDALGRYSSADYKYNNTLPTAVASNSRYREMAFDNFEDYGCTTCTDDHFSFKEIVGSGDISYTESHTGRRSIKVGAKQTIEVEKIILPCGGADGEDDNGGT